VRKLLVWAALLVLATGGALLVTGLGEFHLQMRGPADPHSPLRPGGPGWRRPVPAGGGQRRPRPPGSGGAAGPWAPPSAR
jgi:hypothetical protein